jgi:hypothetical protein
MIIQALRVMVDEAEIAAKVKEGLGAVSQLKEVSFGLAKGIVKIGGKFQVGFAIPFETHWAVEVLQPDCRLGVRLANVSVGFFGVSADTVRAQVMGALSQKLQNASGVRVENDVIVVDPALLLAAKGIRLDAPVKRVDVMQGRVEIEV